MSERRRGEAPRRGRRWPRLWAAWASPWGDRRREAVCLLLAFAWLLLALPRGLAGRSMSGWEPVRSLAAPGAVRCILPAAMDGQALLYVAVERWGVFHSRDGGRNWQPANHLPRRALGRVDVSALALSPDAPRTLLAIAADSAGGHTVFRTCDGGQSWLPRRGLGALDVEGVAIGASGVVYAVGGQKLLRSADGGDTWLEAGIRPGAGRVTALAIDDAAGVLFVGTEADGLWMTSDQGQSWSMLLAGRSVHTLAVTAQGPIYAGTDGGLYISHDRGASWLPLPSPAVGERVVALAVATQVPGRVAVALAGGLVQYSDDGGTIWQRLPPVPWDALVTALALDPLSATHLFAGSGRGLWRCSLPARPGPPADDG